MNFWERVQWAWWKYKSYFWFDDDAEIHANALEDVTSGKTAVDREINTIVNSQNVQTRVPIFSDLADTLQATIKGVGGIAKLLPYIVVAAVAFIGVYLLLMGRKGKAVM